MKIITKIGVFLASIIGLMAAAILPANAALNAGIATGLTSLQNDALDLVDLVWPVTIAVTIAFIILGLFKKAAGKAV